ncbi:carcinoembryonic antigen-related cell adhesion molecule 19 isoform X2 [Prionailurus iriomotensis]
MNPSSILALWVPQGSRAALRIQKIPEHPQKNQDLLLSVRGIPDTFQDFNWYLGEEAHGGTMLFTYIPELQRPQRDGSAMGQRDIVGFPNGSMLLHRAQPTDSGTYQVAVTINPAWTMRAKTKVQVEGKRKTKKQTLERSSWNSSWNCCFLEEETAKQSHNEQKHKEPPITHLPMSAGIMVAIIIGSLAAGALFIGSIAHLLLTRSWRGQSHRMPAPGGQGPRTTTTEEPEAHPNHNAGDENIYEVMPSPTLLVSPLGDPGSANTAMPLPLPENHHYQDLLNPDPAPYCQLVPRP